MHQNTNTKPLLVFVNPASGSGNALKQWNKAIPIFEQYQVKYQAIMTTHQNHCYEFLSKEDLSSYSGIVLVSGDGLPHEAINALYSRKDWDQVSQIPIGVLPGGSGNAFAKTITSLSKLACNSESCALIIAKGITKNIDLMCFEMEEKKIISFLSLSWAFIAEVDLNSEFLRFLGGARFDIYGAWRAIFQKKYIALFNGKQIDLCYFMVQKMPYISSSYHAGPACIVDDGLMDLQYLESGKWSQLVKLALSQADGKHINIGQNDQIICNGDWKYEKVKEFTLQPLSNCPYSIDGEKYLAKPVRGYIIPKALKVFCE